MQPVEPMQSLMGAVAFAALVTASYTDFRTREIPDWLNHGLLTFGLGASLLLSIAFWNPLYLAYSVLGMLVFLGIGYLMFYAGQWGGGDSKMLIALGAVIGLPFAFGTPYFDFRSFIVSFWFNLMLLGVVYATFWTFFLAFKNRKSVFVKLKAMLAKRAKTRLFFLFFAVLVLIAAFFSGHPAMKVLLASVSVVMVFLIYATLFMKAVENVSMLKLVTPDKLTEGDWIVKDVILEGKRITGPSDLGITKEQISTLQSFHSKGRIKKVLIKVGIPFVPSYLLAFVATFFYGNLILGITRAVTF